MISLLAKKGIHLEFRIDQFDFDAKDDLTTWAKLHQLSLRMTQQYHLTGRETRLRIEPKRFISAKC